VLCGDHASGVEKAQCDEDAEDEAAHVGEESHPPPFPEALTTPKFASMSWNRNHMPR
jgi:hypothetical protein